MTRRPAPAEAPSLSRLTPRRTAGSTWASLGCVRIEAAEGAEVEALGERGGRHHAFGGLGSPAAKTARGVLPVPSASWIALAITTRLACGASCRSRKMASLVRPCSAAICAPPASRLASTWRWTVLWPSVVDRARALRRGWHHCCPAAGHRRPLQPHGFIPRGRAELREHLADVYAALLAADAQDVDVRSKLPGSTLPGDENLQYLAVRRPVIEWALPRVMTRASTCATESVSVASASKVEE